jgi:hypothetical protein
MTGRCRRSRKGSADLLELLRNAEGGEVDFLGEDVAGAGAGSHTARHGRVPDGPRVQSRHVNLDVSSDWLVNRCGCVGRPSWPGQCGLSKIRRSHQEGHLEGEA